MAINFAAWFAQLFSPVSATILSLSLARAVCCLSSKTRQHTLAADERVWSVYQPAIGFPLVPAMLRSSRNWAKCSQIVVKPKWDVAKPSKLVHPRTIDVSSSASMHTKFEGISS